MTIDRTANAREFPWERPARERRPAEHARRGALPQTETRRPVPTLSGLGFDRGGDTLSLLPDLLREAAAAINAAETRVTQIQADMTQEVEAAERRAKAAEALASDLEQKAMAAIRAAEERAEAAEARLVAAEHFIARLRALVQHPF